MKKNEAISILATSARPREQKDRERYDEAVKMAVDALNEPEQQWIPCSERLPDTPIRVQVQLDNGWIITAYRQEDEWLSVPDCEEALHDEWVIAWMPLPESYKGEQP